MNINCALSVQKQPESIALKKRIKELEEQLNTVTVERDRLRFAANHDALTGLKNRTALDAEIIQRWENAYSNDHAVVIMVVDADNFKVVNDTQGHAAGDSVLKRLAGAIASSMRTGRDRGNDALISSESYRQGGEEFVAIFEVPADGHQMEYATNIAERIRNACEPINTVSIGVSVTQPPFRFNGSSDALRRADEALYTAKNGGRNRVAIA